MTSQRGNKTKNKEVKITSIIDITNQMVKGAAKELIGVIV